MTNTQTLDTILNSMENLVSGLSAAGFAIVVTVINIPLAVLVPSTSGHAAWRCPAGAVGRLRGGLPADNHHRAWMSGAGLTMLWAPTQVVVVGGLAIAKVGYDVTCASSGR